MQIFSFPRLAKVSYLTVDLWYKRFGIINKPLLTTLGIPNSMCQEPVFGCLFDLFKICSDVTFCLGRELKGIPPNRSIR